MRDARRRDTRFGQWPSIGAFASPEAAWLRFEEVHWPVGGIGVVAVSSPPERLGPFPPCFEGRCGRWTW